jgi:putative nucleotidyltransferase with HDIG domain
LSVYLIAIVLAVGLGRLLSYDPWRAEIIPLMATVMVLAIAYNQVLAALTAFMLALIITYSTVGEMGQFVLLMSVAATAVIPLSRVPSRSTLIKVGFWTAGVYFVVSWGNGIIQSQSLSEVWSDNTLLFTSLRGAAWCLVGGYLVAGSLPFIESAFDVVTDISLLEMSDISHPLLHELVRRAPGTYNHSITVATIGEAAADRIGANGLLVRVGAYFHDVGKMLKPEYFVENMTEGTASRHERLAPAMSTLIIIGHVKDGVDLALRHGVPQRVVQYFYHAAAKQAGQQPDHKTDAEESSFRYPGPKPQSRETGVLMLADAVEGASRALSDPTPKRIEGLVHDLTMRRLLDGQFDECSLTLGEIHAIEESLTKSLIGIYHGRIKYPEQRTA